MSIFTIIASPLCISVTTPSLQRQRAVDFFMKCFLMIVLEKAPFNKSLYNSKIFGEYNVINKSSYSTPSSLKNLEKTQIFPHQQCLLCVKSRMVVAVDHYFLVTMAAVAPRIFIPKLHLDSANFVFFHKNKTYFREQIFILLKKKKRVSANEIASVYS